MDSSTDDADIAIIGAGAAGLASAIFAAETDVHKQLKIVLFEGAKKPGAKILVSGGGRCNVTHHRVTSDDYHGNKNVIRNILRAFDENRTVDWFQSLGVELKREDTGKLFPVSDRATSVLEALLERCRELGVELRSGCRISTIARHDNGFQICSDSTEVCARYLIVTTGGQSLPKSGSDGHGWTMMEGLGHSVSDRWPALVPLTLADGHGHVELSGISHPTLLSVVVDGKVVSSSSGEMLWTHTGISGPVAMDISREWIRHQQLDHQPRLHLTFFPGEKREAIEEWILQCGRDHPQRSISQSLATRIPRRIVQFIGNHAQLDTSTKISQLPREARRRLLEQLTHHSLEITGDRGWRLAEVTAGGIPLEEIAYQRMESRLQDNLFLAGEILDCDGRIGGFNFQWAWSTGFLAGSSCARSALRENTATS